MAFSYAGNVKVVGTDKLCFPAKVDTLEPLACSSYDPYPYQDDEGAVEIISVGEWNLRRNLLREHRHGV